MTRWPRVVEIEPPKGKIRARLTLSCGHTITPDLTDQWIKNAEALRNKRFPCPKGCVEYPAAA